jgi:exopolysaccharide production protein ExoZ
MGLREGDMPRSFRTIQYLRALAALLVVFQHALQQIPAFAKIWPTTIGEGGVDLFFVISGFVMFYSAGRAPMTRGEFVRKRIERIVPLYWIMTFATAALLIVAPSLPRDSRFTLASLVQSLLFAPHPNPGDPGSISPMLKLGWTLNYEMFFYALFAIGIGLAPLRRAIAIGCVFAALSLWALAPHAPVAVTFWGDTVVYEFLLGALLACAVLGKAVARIPAPAAVAVALAGVAEFIGLADAAGPRLLSQGLPAALIVAGVVILEANGRWRVESRALQALGDGSYSLYLGHLYPVIAFRVLWERARLPAEGALWAVFFIGLCMAAGTGAGLGLHRFVERPITRRLKGLRRPAGAQLSPTPAG